MYRCQLCGTIAPSRTPCHKVVVERRAKRYPMREGVFRVVEHSKEGRKRVVLKDDPGGEGFEIVREAIACPRCAAERR
jgi:hypothetical protein